ncbi:MAG: hypothetical protein WCC72_01725, partial [Dehalococcoidales bacterium]
CISDSLLILFFHSFFFSFPQIKKRGKDYPFALLRSVRPTIEGKGFAFALKCFDRLNIQLKSNHFTSLNLYKSAIIQQITEADT